MTKTHRYLAHLFVSFLFLIGGCATLEIENSVPQENPESHEEWHHIGFLRTQELSEPVDFYNRCGGHEWESAQIQKTWTQSLMSLVTAVIYDPWQVTYRCSPKQTTTNRVETQPHPPE